MAEIGHSRGKWQTAVRAARKHACRRGETVRFGWNAASEAWVIYTGRAPHNVRSITSVTARNCRHKRSR